MRLKRAGLAAIMLAGALVTVSVSLAAEFTADETAAILLHGPWPPAFQADSTNRVSGKRAAIRFGETLFRDPRLSADGSMACSDCHRPDLAFSDGLPTPAGRSEMTRNTPATTNLSGRRWFGWDGASDSLWAASIRPVLNGAEMNNTAESVAATIRENADLRAGYRDSFGVPPGQVAADRLLADIGKALAAWQETQATPRTAFDDFRDRLAAGDTAAMADYSVPAQRGLKLFVGKGRCSLCHYGPAFSNGEFADVTVPFFIPGGVDKGRYGGIRALRDNPFSRIGLHSDDPSPSAQRQTRQVRLLHRNFGEFRVPSLRSIVQTAPYMHDGSLARLEDVIGHYSELDESRLHVDGERILRPLNLTAGEKADLLAFLRTL